MSVIDEYLKDIHEPDKTGLIGIRDLIKRIVPDADEVISYGMPGFKYKGKYLAGFNAFKNHLSFFPTAEPVEVLKDKLAEYAVSKGTLQFTPDHPLPDELIEELIAIRIKSIDKGLD